MLKGWKTLKKHQKAFFAHIRKPMEMMADLLFHWQPSTQFAVSGWFSTIYPRLIGQGDGNILTYALTFAFPDFGNAVIGTIRTTFRF